MRQTPGYTRRRRAMVFPARSPIGPRPAACSDRADAPENRKLSCGDSNLLGRSALGEAHGCSRCAATPGRRLSLPPGSWLVLIGLGVLATWLSLREETTDGWTQLKNTSSTLPAPHERTRALANVRKFVTGRLNEHVEGQPPLDLTVVPAPEALPGQTESDFERHSAREHPSQRLDMRSGSAAGACVGKGLVNYR